MHINGDVVQVQHNLKRSDKYIRNFIKSLYTDKCVICMVLLLIIMIIIIIFKTINK